MPTTETLTSLLTYSLATYRATRLVIEDNITEDLRNKAFAELDKLPNKLARKLEYFLTCPWCVSIWAAGFLLTLRLFAPTLADLLALLLATSATTGLIYEHS